MLFLAPCLPALHIIFCQLGLLFIHKIKQVFALHFLDSIAQHFSHAAVDKYSVTILIDLPDAFIKIFNQQLVFLLTFSKDPSTCVRLS